jgi:hypothetical protein
MNLDDAQRQKVAEWIAQGLRLSDIQTKLASELGVTLTYMEVRFLVDDLKLTPKDIEPVRPAEAVLAAAAAQSPKGAPPTAGRPGPGAPQPAPLAGGVGRVSLTVDELTRPGAVVSGKVTFSDGQTAAWQIDQMGQLGLIAEKPGYRPPPSDVQPFQAALERELSKLGF